MEKIRTNNNSKESGIALVTALVITVVVLMLISSLNLSLYKGFPDKHNKQAIQHCL